MRNKLWTVALAAAVLLPNTVTAQFTPAPDSGDGHLLRNCLITIIDEVQLPAREAGVLTALEVREGQLVNEGQLVAQIEDDKSRKQLELATLEYQVAMAQYENDVDERYYTMAARLALVDVQDAERANERVVNAISEFEMRRRKLTYERSRLQIEQAQRDKKIAGMNAGIAAQKVKVAQNEIERRRVVAPFTGVVAETYPHAGEWVNPGEPIMRVLRMDRLRVEGFVKAEEFSPSEIYGKSVTVEIQLSGARRERFQGTIGFVSPDVEASGEYRVWTEIQNRPEGDFYLVNPGLSATMHVNVRAAAAGTGTQRR
jgi:macrolide-specific efflux system membrane fusion protein